MSWPIGILWVSPARIRLRPLWLHRLYQRLNQAFSFATMFATLRHTSRNNANPASTWCVPSSPSNILWLVNFTGSTINVWQKKLTTTRLKRVRTNMSELFNAWIRRKNFVLNSMNWYSHRFWMQEAISFWNANLGNMPKYITKRSTATTRKRKNANAKKWVGELSIGNKFWNIRRGPAKDICISWTGLRWVPDLENNQKKNKKNRRLYEARNFPEICVFFVFCFFPGIGRADGRGRQKKELSALFGRLRILPRSPIVFKQLFINEVYEVDTSNIAFWR